MPMFEMPKSRNSQVTLPASCGVIILVIWTARKCYIANHHTGGAPSPQQPPDMTATMTESRGFIENVLMIHSSKVDGQYRADYDKLFQQALEAEYAKE